VTASVIWKLRITLGAAVGLAVARARMERSLANTLAELPSRPGIAIAAAALMLAAMLLATGAHVQSNRWGGTAYGSAAPDRLTRSLVDARPGSYGLTSYSGTTKDGRSQESPGLDLMVRSTQAFASTARRPAIPLVRRRMDQPALVAIGAVTS
jgi:hypothetical protein